MITIPVVTGVSSAAAEISMPRLQFLCLAVLDSARQSMTVAAWKITGSLA
jgi:hypothetical protein